MLPKYKYGLLLFGFLAIVFFVFGIHLSHREFKEISQTESTQATVLAYSAISDKPNEKYQFDVSFRLKNGTIEHAQIILPAFEAEDAIKNGHFDILYNTKTPQKIYRMQSRMLPVLCFLLSASSFISMNVYRRKWLKTRNTRSASSKKSIDLAR